MHNARIKAIQVVALLGTLALAATACGGSSSGGSSGALSGVSLTVGSKEFTEQLVLGQIAIQALENAGADVTDQTNITGTTNTRKALTSGQIDMYWEYTGTGYAEILGHNAANAPSDEQKLFDKIAKEDLKKNNIKWFALAPANDAYAIATSQHAVNQFGVHSLSDYAGLANKDPASASLCLASEFRDRPDGFAGMEKAYGFKLPDSSITEVDLGIVFTQVPSGDKCNFGEVFTTDGRIPANHMVVLDDNKNFFVKYNVAMTMNNDLYKRYPEVAKIITPIANKLTTTTMQKLNSEVDVQGLPAEEVAKTWLQDNGFIG